MVIVAGWKGWVPAFEGICCWFGCPWQTRKQWENVAVSGEIYDQKPIAFSQLLRFFFRGSRLEQIHLKFCFGASRKQQNSFSFPDDISCWCNGNYTGFCLQSKFILLTFTKIQSSLTIFLKMRLSPTVFSSYLPKTR